MYKMPSQTQRVTSSIAKKNRAIRRSRYIAGSRARIPPIVKRSYGKSITAKLAWVTSAQTTALLNWTDVYGIYTIMSNANDWSNFKGAYTLMNVLNITVKMYPQAWPYAAGIDRIAGVCYSVKDNVGIGSLGSICDHEQHKLVNLGLAQDPFVVFSARTKALVAMPVSTSNNYENWGYIKGFAATADFGGLAGSIMKLEFSVTVCFSSEA